MTTENRVGYWFRPATIERNNFKFKSLSCWSYNIAVGCTHACRFCVSGDALIQMASGLTKPLREIEVGDIILTIGENKRYCEATVTAKMRTFREAYTLRTDNAEVICSDDHRWLTSRGWKFTTGTEQGKARRPHLTVNNQIYTIGSHQSPRPFNDNYKRGYLAGLIRGDGVINRYDYSGRHPHRQAKDIQHQFRLFMKDPEPLLRAKAWLLEFGVDTNHFEFKTGSRSYPGIRISTRSAYERIIKLIEAQKDTDWRRGWLGGFFDAEGSASTRMTNGNQEWLTITKECLAEFGFDVVHEKMTDGIDNIRYRGGIAERIRFYQTVAPSISRKLGICRSSAKLLAKVIEIIPMGKRVEMFDITTTAGTFIANGLLAHNCYVPEVSTRRMADRLTPYGIKDPDEEWGDYLLLRPWDAAKFSGSLRTAENWKRDELNPDGNRAVMLCTTTDPYQVIKHPDPTKQRQLQEDLERVVRFALENILHNSTLNVRILTRSPLAARHFDLYREFGKRLLFGMSIPTLDNVLARIYEPHAPAPSARLQCLRKAKLAGLHVYAAVAPTYPECDMADLEMTLSTLRELDPVTIFHEPINIRAENVARISEHAKSVGVEINTEVFKSPEAWADYAMTQLTMVETIARDLGLSQLHLWPDYGLRRFQKDTTWLNKWWNRISEWPTV